MHITVDAGDFDVSIQGDESQLITMLGGCEYAKQWLMSQIMARQSGAYQRDTMVPHCAPTETPYTKARTVSKHEAMNEYLAARDVLDQRLQTIVRADERATFEIPEYFSNL